MLATQYSINLPADYDMGIIRERVRERGSALDALDGLGAKAYLITETAAGATANRYAPFSLWGDPVAAATFFTGAGFGGLVRDFGRPVVEQWLGLDVRLGATAGGPPTSATREVVLVGDRGDLAAVRAEGLAWLEACASDGRHLYAAATGLDPASWRVVRFALWAYPATEAARVPGSDFTAYEVLHLSRPELEEL